VQELNSHPEEIIDEIMGMEHRPGLSRFLVEIQIEGQVGNIRVNPFPLMLNLMSLCIFPFFARPLFRELVGISDDTYMKLLQQRHREVFDFVKHALCKS